MIAALGPLFVGPLADWHDALVLPADPRPAVRLATLLDDEDALGRCLAHYGRDVPDGDRRALASEWSKRYFVRLLPPVLAAALVLDHGLPLDVAGIDLVLGDDGAPSAFKLPDGGAPCTVPPTGGALALLAPLIDDHLAPVIRALSRHSRLSPRVFWSNAGNYVESVVRVLAERRLPRDMGAGAETGAGARAGAGAGAHAGPSASAKAGTGTAGRAAACNVLDVVQRSHRPDGRSNPFFNTVRYRELAATEPASFTGRDTSDDLVMADVPADRRWRQRRVCCVRYLLPARPLCANCPLLPGPAPQDAADIP